FLTPTRSTPRSTISCTSSGQAASDAAAAELPDAPDAGDEAAGEAAVELPDAPQAVSIARDTRPASRALHFFFITEFPPSMVSISKQRPRAGLRLKERFSG